MVDDDEDEYLLTKDIFNDIEYTLYELDWVSNYDKAKEIICEDKHHAYLIDFYLGAKNGLELIAECLKCTTAPMLLLTGIQNYEIDERARRSGAADYILKSELKPYVLDRTIRYSIERQKNLQEIISLNSTLEKRVIDRTSQLDSVIKELEKKNENLSRAEAEVRKALGKEKELNELKSRFVSMASHEFRTPLATILTSVSLIKRYEKAEEQDMREKHINRIEENVKHLNAVLSDFLNLGKLEEGIIDISEHYFDVNAFIQNIVNDLSINLKPGQEIILNLPKKHFLIKSDKKILTIVLINLISNASKYSPEGKDIIVDVKFLSKYMKINIKDYGIGISTSDKKHIFERFFRARNAENEPGTGLGLNIVKKYLELLSGSISFESEMGQGSSFELKIPVSYKTQSIDLTS